MLGSRLETKRNLEILNAMKNQYKDHIYDEYIAGFYNGMETCIALLENRPAEHVLYEESKVDSAEQKGKRTKHGGKHIKGVIG